MKFKKGDRVYWVHNLSSCEDKKMIGTIKLCYSELSDEGQFYPEVYDIDCDKGFTVTGFLPIVVHVL